LLGITGVGSQLNLADNDMIIDYTGGSPLGAGATYSGISKLLRDGRNGGGWNGTGIVTSMTAAQAPSTLTTLGVAEASAVVGPAGGTWNGQSVDNTALLIKYTHLGDANLSGNIDADDYFQLDSGYSRGSKGYFNGDFDYSQGVDGDDYFGIDSNYSNGQVALITVPASTLEESEPVVMEIEAPSVATSGVSGAEIPTFDDAKESDEKSLLEELAVM
jgi:hypothetical protein